METLRFGQHETLTPAQVVNPLAASIYESTGGVQQPSVAWKSLGKIRQRIRKTGGFCRYRPQIIIGLVRARELTGTTRTTTATVRRLPAEESELSLHSELAKAQV